MATCDLTVLDLPRFRFGSNYQSNSQRFHHFPLHFLQKSLRRRPSLHWLLCNASKSVWEEKKHGGMVPSGNLLHDYRKSPFLMGKSTISMAIFNSHISLPEGIQHELWILWMSGFVKRTSMFCHVCVQRKNVFYIQSIWIYPSEIERLGYCRLVLFPSLAWWRWNTGVHIHIHIHIHIHTHTHIHIHIHTHIHIHIHIHITYTYTYKYIYHKITNDSLVGGCDPSQANQKKSRRLWIKTL